MKGKTAGKIIALFAVAGMLAGCGGKTGTTPDDYATNDGYITTETAGNSTGGAQSDTTSGTAGISKENIKVGVLYISDPDEGSGYSYTHDLGIVGMQENLGLSDDQIERKIVDDSDAKATEEAIEACISDGCNIIFTTSWGYMETTAEMAEKYPDIFSQKDTSVLTIDVERTFWEKLTILHKIANFPDGKPLPARYARHLYDVYNMGNSWVKERAFKRKELLEKDVAFKQKFYYAKGAHYETATLSSIELLPKEAVLNALKEDYQAMRNMIYGNIPEFEAILEFLEKLQEEVHGLE